MVGGRTLKRVVRVSAWWADGGAVEEASAGVGAGVGEDGVVCDGERGDRAYVAAVGGDVGEAALSMLGGGLVGDVFIVQEDLAGLDGAEVEEGFGEVGLAVAVDAGDAEDFVGVEGEGEVVDAEVAGVVADVEVLDAEDGGAGG